MQLAVEDHVEAMERSEGVLGPVPQHETRTDPEQPSTLLEASTGFGTGTMRPSVQSYRSCLSAEPEQTCWKVDRRHSSSQWW